MNTNTRGRVLLLLTCLLLTACAGGGGGAGDPGPGQGGPGGEDPVPADASVAVDRALLTVPNITARSATDSFSARDDQTFPASSVEWSRGAFPAVVTRRANGSTSIIYGVRETRRIDFSSSDLMENAAGVESYLRGVHQYVEFSGLEDGTSFDFLRVGLLLAGGEQFDAVPLYYGYDQPLDRRVRFGEATYAGSAVGLLKLGTQFDPAKFYFLDAGVSLKIDFGNGVFEGRLTSITGENFDGEALKVTPEISFNGWITGGSYVLDGWAVGSGGSTVGGVGSMSGRIFGPEGEEFAGIWQTEVTGMSERAESWGTFGAKRSDFVFGATKYLASAAGSTRALVQRSIVVSGTGGSAAYGDISSTAVNLIARTDGGVTLKPAIGSAKADFGFRDFTLPSATDLFPSLSAVRADKELLISAHLEYSAFGHWAEPDVTTPTSTRYHFFTTGVPTPAANVPTLGLAHYYGRASGFASTPEGVSPIHLRTTISANFGARTVDALLESMDGGSIYRHPTGGGITTVKGVGTISGNSVSASLSQMTATVPVSGNLTGKFYGPEAQELLGHWNLSAPDLDFKASGSFGAAQ